MSGPRTPWWMYVIASSFLGYFALQLYVASPFYPGPVSIGLVFDSRSSSVIVAQVETGSVVERAGLRAGDRIVSANAIPIIRHVQWDVAGMTFEVGRPLPLVIEREGRQLEFLVTLERQPWHPLSGKFLLLAATDLLTLALAFVIAFRRPYDLVARIGALFLATAAISIYPPLYGFLSAWRHLPAPLGALLWIADISELLFAPIFFTFFAIFPRPLFQRSWVWVLIWAPYLILTGSYLHVQYALVYKTPATITPPIISIPAYFALRGCYVLGALIVLLMNYRRLRDISEKRRMRVLVVGSVVGWVAMGTFLGFIVVGGGRVTGRITAAIISTPITLALFGLYLLFPVSFAYAILRHRVFDLGVIVRRGLQYALARGVLLTAVPLLGLILVADLLLHGQRPLLEILRARGWIYVVLAGLDVVAYVKRQTWLEALDRRFFRERFDAQRLLREVIEEIHKARSFMQVAPHVVARLEATLHPEFAALLVREPREATYRTLAVAPAESLVPELPAQSKLMAMVRLLGKPLEVPQTGSSWLGEQLPHEETEFLRQARVEFLVPIATAPERTEAVLVLGIKRSEEPYSREDRDLLMAIAASLALLVENPSGATAQRSDLFEECPQCGACYDSGASLCAREGARLMPVILPRLLEGRYALERRLGRGGMGTVYAALDTSLERRVAVKVIREDLVGSAEAAERFRQEARIAASFAHPNVVTVHDFGVAAGSRAFLVMELQEGETLRDALRREGRFAIARTLAILADVTAALEAAHRRQLVHRDLKPENVFLSRTESGQTAKVLDFGIAKFLSSPNQQSTVDTASGALLGTPRYMSPEQRHGGEAHPAWDVWALSVVAYEVLTGAYPFDESSPAKQFGADGSSKLIPVNTHLPGAPQSCQELFECSFSSERALRPQSAQAFLSQLQSSLA